MKLIARILLFLFIAFLSTPTIVTVIKKSSDTSMFFNCSEEEQAHKELKSAIYIPVFGHELVVPVLSDPKLTMSESIVKLDNISPSIFVPPPNLI